MHRHFLNFATSTSLYSACSFHCNVTSKSQQWTKLGQVARGLLGIPTASTSSERSFSTAVTVNVNERRTQLSGDSVDGLLFLHELV